MLRWNLAAAGLLVLLAASCADDASTTEQGESADAGVDAQTTEEDMAPAIEVDRSKTIGSLTGEEAGALCEEFRTYFESNLPREERLRFNCAVTGIFTGAFDMSVDTDEKLQEACVPIRDMCIEEGLQVDDFLCPIAAGTTCEATVEQAEACHQADTQTNAEYFAMITCEDAQLRQAGGQGLGEIPLPPECETFYSLCPELE